MQDEMYLLQEEYWHDVDGNSISPIDIYRSKDDAVREAARLNESQGWSKTYNSLTFTVVTYKVK
ncbi:hypothetical protein D3C75_547910 [compost metagenome]